jgi:competence protein ComEC
LHRLAPASVTVEGTLRTDPSPRDRGWSAIVDVSLVRAEGGSTRVDETLWVAGDGEPPVAVRGDRVQVAGGLRWPDDVGFAGSLLRRGIVAELLAEELRRTGPSANPVLRAAQSFRAFAGRSIAALFPQPEAGLLLGLALGDDSRLDPGLVRDFKATGLGHLLVVSGENVAMVLAPVLALAAALGLSRVPRLLLASGVVGFFVVLTGAEPSVMRAGVMAGLALFGAFLGRPGGAAGTLSGAVLILLALDPALVWAIGFQLSVAATAGMVALASPIAARLRFLPGWLALATGATLAAQIAVTPVLLYHFHEVPLVTLPANVLAFPAVSPALLLGLAAATTGLVVPGLGRVLAGAALVPMRYLELVADRLASAPVPWITSSAGLATIVIGVPLVVAVAWWFRSGRRPPRLAMLAGVALLPLVVWASALRAGPPEGLTVRFFDVGQGDAALVTSPGGVAILVDGGPESDQVATELAALGVKRLDVVVATHPHADHVAGLPAVLSRIPVGLVLDPGCPSDSIDEAEMLQVIEDEGIPVRAPRVGEALLVGDLRLEFLAPSSCWTGTASDPNNDSIVFRLSLGDNTVLFPGDTEEPAQELILAGGADLDVDVLKVPHHGGGTSTQAFLDATRPEVTVVSVGQPNDYGHPVPAVLGWLRAAGAAVLRTDRLGDIIITFGQDGISIGSAG